MTASAIAASAADRTAVASTLARLSAAWQNRHYEELAISLDERVVMSLPGFGGRVEGREALIESYREFMDRVTLTHYEEEPPAIDVFGNTAIASVRWKMDWITGGADNSAAGHDLFVLHGARESAGRNDWRIVWRTMMLDPGVA